MREKVVRVEPEPESRKLSAAPRDRQGPHCGYPSILGVPGLRQLQRLCGNAATVQLMQARDRKLASSVTVQRDVPEPSSTDWDDYVKSRQQLDEFIQRAPKALRGHRATTGNGEFDVTYHPEDSRLEVTIPCAFKFLPREKVDLIPTRPGTPPLVKNVLVGWSASEQQEWKAKFFETCRSVWSGQFTLYCQRRWWEALIAVVDIHFVERAAPQGVMASKDDDPVTSGKPAVPTALEIDPDTLAENGISGRSGKLSEDSILPSKAPGNEGHITAAHEAGHMFGLGDEYVMTPGLVATASAQQRQNFVHLANTPEAKHSPLVEAEFGKKVLKADTELQAIMSRGMKVLPQHGVTFLEALNELTVSWCHWSLSPAEKTPVPSDPNQPGPGDFPQPSGDVRPA